MARLDHAQPTASTIVQRLGLLAVLVVTWGNLLVVRIDGIDGDNNAKISSRVEPIGRRRLPVQPRARRTRRGGRQCACRNHRARTGRLAGVSRAESAGGVAQCEHRHGLERESAQAALAATYWAGLVERRDPRSAAIHAGATGRGRGGRVFGLRHRQRDLGPSGPGAILRWPGRRGPPHNAHVLAGRIYTLGATGVLDCLAASDGRVLWSRDIVADSGGALPMWGFSSSPLVAEGLVCVWAGGAGGEGTSGLSNRYGRAGLDASNRSQQLQLAATYFSGRQVADSVSQR